MHISRPECVKTDAETVDAMCFLKNVLLTRLQILTVRWEPWTEVEKEELGKCAALGVIYNLWSTMFQSLTQRYWELCAWGQRPPKLSRMMRKVSQLGRQGNLNSRSPRIIWITLWYIREPGGPICQGCLENVVADAIKCRLTESERLHLSYMHPCTRPAPGPPAEMKSKEGVLDSSVRLQAMQLLKKVRTPYLLWKAPVPAVGLPNEELQHDVVRCKLAPVGIYGERGNHMLPNSPYSVRQI